MSLAAFIEKAKQQQPISFNETIEVITAHYDYQPTEFSNGLGEYALISPAGTNEGSCKIFTFAQLHQLDQQQTLNLFGDFYHTDVLNDPNGTSHQNIRNFIRDGWAGIQLNGTALTSK